jgi:hypothetical protein
MTDPTQPLDDSSEPMSATKQAWWASAWPKKLPLKQPRVALFHYAMNGTLRPTEPTETMAFGYTNMKKFHDRESGIILDVIEAQDPDFFSTFPRKPGTELTPEFKRAAIGEAAKAFYHHNQAAYSKPKLRKQTPSSTPQPLVTI